MCLRVGYTFNIFIFILCVDVLTILHKYHSSLGSLNLKTHTCILWLERKLTIILHLNTLYYMNTKNKKINKHSLYNTHI